MKVNGKQLTLERGRQGLTLEGLAAKAGVVHSTLSKIERGKCSPRIDTLGKVANALGKDIEDFIIK